jgi:hypothetical protein
MLQFGRSRISLIGTKANSPVSSNATIHRHCSPSICHAMHVPFRLLGVMPEGRLEDVTRTWMGLVSSVVIPNI